MDFNNIKQFPHSSYHVDIGWDYLQTWLNETDKDYGLDLDPPYQRGYKWSEYQKSAYIEYNLKGGFSGKDIFWNCAGWNGRSRLQGPMELVDGKQRLNAVLEFMQNRVPVFNGITYSRFTGKPRIYNFRFKFHINSLENRKDVVDWYLGLNTGGSIHTKEDLAPAYEYLKKVSN